MAYIFSDSEKNRIAQNQKQKLQQEINDRKKSLGLQNIAPLKNQSEYQQLQDLTEESNHIKEIMQAEKEKRKAEKEKRRKEEISRRKNNWAEERFLKMKEERAREAYNKRKISL